MAERSYQTRKISYISDKIANIKKNTSEAINSKPFFKRMPDQILLLLMISNQNAVIILQMGN